MGDVRLFTIQPKALGRGLGMAISAVVITPCLIGAVLLGVKGQPTALALLAVSAVIATFFSRFSWPRVRATPDHLIVRNFLRTRTLARSNIQEFHLGHSMYSAPSPLLAAPAIVVALISGETVSLDATIVPLYIAGTADQQVWLSRLQRWADPEQTPSDP